MRPAPPDLSFALIAALATCVCAALAWRFDAEDDRRARWPQVEGRVGRASARARGVGYQPQLEYAYTLAGRTLAGNEVSRPGWFVSRADLDGFIAHHPVGSPISVRYDPKDPKRSYVNCDAAYASARPWSSTLLVVGASLSLLVTVMLGNAWLAKRRELRRRR